MARALRAVPARPEAGVAYVRVSALMGRGGERFHSPDMQADAVKAMFASTGTPVVEVIEDLDVSGRAGRDGVFAREGLDRVLALAESRRISAVGIYDLSRLGRDTAESLRTIRHLRELGVRVASTVERFDDGPEGQFMLTQFLAMAQLYSDQIGRRWQQALARVVDQGAWPRVAPIGYVKNGRTLAPHPTLGPAISDLFSRYAVGVGTAELARDLSEARGSLTRLFVVRRILDHPLYRGRIVWAGREWPGQHPALVDEQTWALVRERRARDSRTPSRTLAAAHPLAGLLICDSCSTAAWVRRDGRDGSTRYICGLQQEAGGCPGCGSAPTGQVIQAVLDVVAARAGRLGARVKDREVQDGRRMRARSDVTRLTAELLRAEQALGALAADRALRVVSETAYRAGADRLETMTDSIRRRLDTARRIAALPPGRQAGGRLTGLPAVWADPLVTDAERNRLLRTVVQQVRLRRSAFYREPPAARLTVKFL